MTNDRRLTLCIIAGPNGSGKTTTTMQLLQYEWTEGSVYINPDDIAQERFGDWNSPDAVKKAALYATKLRYDCLREHKDLVFETVFSSEEKLDFVRKAKAEGYFIRIFFVCTDSPEINIRRITKRWMAGGHEVPISKVVSRYYKSLLNISIAAKLADRLYIYDNSAEDRLPRLLFRMVDGNIYRRYVTDIPAWAQSLEMKDEE